MRPDRSGVKGKKDTPDHRLSHQVDMHNAPTPVRQDDQHNEQIKTD